MDVVFSAIAADGMHPVCLYITEGVQSIPQFFNVPDLKMSTSSSNDDTVSIIEAL